MTELVQNIAGTIKLKCQTDILKYSESFINNSIQKRMRETNCASNNKYLSLLETNVEEAEALLDSFQISYSEFFRNSLTFAVLEHIVVPSLIAKKLQGKRNELRIWSAACAAGQEAYSMAILLEELMERNNHSFTYRIFATDQNESQIYLGSRGEFEKDSLRNLSLLRTNKWFINTGNICSVKSVIKEKIDFSRFDLCDSQLSSPAASIYGEFDIVFCANLLFYYNNDVRKTILNKIRSPLTKEGYVVTGETERDIMVSQGFSEVFPKSAIFQN